jgi:hypothetical protein
MPGTGHFLFYPCSKNYFLACRFIDPEKKVPALV